MAVGSEQEQDRTEPATPFKLREARKRGQVAKSLEINSLLLLSVALLVSYFLGESFVSQQLALSRELFVKAGGIELDGRTVIQLFTYTFTFLANMLWPFVGAVMLAGILGNLFQTGPVFSFFPLKPDPARLNPVNGFKRLFSKKLLFESLKTFVKMGVFGSIIYFSFANVLPKLLTMVDTDPRVYPLLLMEQARALAYQLLLAVLLVALLDLMYSRWEYSQQMRMSRRELKEEVKRREGDPQIRARRRQLQKEAVKRAGALQQVPEADVLITNPTHLSIALRYERGENAAPQVIAKGASELALKMRQVARKHDVPVVENRALARDLFNKVAIDESVPESLYPAVARILAWIFLLREQRAARAARSVI